MRLIINGEEAVLEAAVLSQVLEHFGLKDKMVVAEIDGEIVSRELWEQTELREGMKIELVHFVGGG